VLTLNIHHDVDILRPKCVGEKYNGNKYCILILCVRDGTERFQLSKWNVGTKTDAKKIARF
jgi:hypothetical protein